MHVGLSQPIMFSFLFGSPHGQTTSSPESSDRASVDASEKVNVKMSVLNIKMISCNELF